MHSKVLELAKHFGVAFADRNACENHIFDGKTIAIRGGWPDVIDENCDCVYQDYDGPERKPRIFSDHDLLHEVAHYAVAFPEQRDLPEYGLESVSIAGEDYVPNVVDNIDYSMGYPPEATTQEFMAQMLCMIWGKAYGINVALSGTDNVYANWNAYEAFKFKEVSNHRNWIKCAWKAMIRLDQMGMLRKLPIPI